MSSRALVCLSARMMGCPDSENGKETGLKEVKTICDDWLDVMSRKKVTVMTPSFLAF